MAAGGAHHITVMSATDALPSLYYFHLGVRVNSITGMIELCVNIDCLYSTFTASVRYESHNFYICDIPWSAAGSVITRLSSLYILL